MTVAGRVSLATGKPAVAVLIIIVLLAFWCGQGSSAENQTPSADARDTARKAGGTGLESLNPYDIVGFVRKNTTHDALWERLRIPAIDAEPVTEWDAEWYEFELDRQCSRGAIVVLKGLDNNRYRFLALREAARGGWEFLGYVDGYHKYVDARSRIVNSERNAWLVIRHEICGGTGCLSSNESWYLIGDGAKALPEVLSYPVRGFVMRIDCPPNREFSSRVIEQKEAKKGFTVKVRLSVRYTGLYFDSYDDDYRPSVDVAILGRQQQAQFIWNSRAGKFIPDRKNSISAKELESVYTCEDLDDRDFLKYNKSELLKIASGADRLEKRWLKSFLKGLKDSPEKRALTKALR